MYSVGKVCTDCEGAADAACSLADAAPGGSSAGAGPGGGCAGGGCDPSTDGAVRSGQRRSKMKRSLSACYNSALVSVGRGRK